MKTVKKDREIARAVAALQSVPRALLAQVTSQQLVIAFGLSLHEVTVQKLRRQLLGKKVQRENGAKNRPHDLKRSSQPDLDPIAGLEPQLVLELLARIGTKTYAYCGENEKLGTEEAQRLMLRVMRHYQPSLLPRNASRSLPNFPVEEVTPSEF